MLSTFFHRAGHSLGIVFALLLSGVSHAADTFTTSERSANTQIRSTETQHFEQSLQSTGFTRPVVIPETGQSRVFYLPVPRKLEMTDRQLRFQARYLAGDETGGRLQLLVDGVPVYARAYPGGQGVIDLTLPLAAARGSNGFVQLDVNWLRNKTLQTCEIEPPNATSLLVEPTTGIGYHVPASGALDLASAWQLIAAEGRLTVSDTEVNQEAFDTAWRLGAALELAGKRMHIQRLPVLGDSVPGGLSTVPAELASHPIVRQLAESTHLTLTSDSALGALLLLDSTRVLGDVVVYDTALQQRIQQAVAAFATTLDTEEQRAWFNKATTAAGFDPDTTNNLFLVGSAPRRIVAVRAGHGAKAAAILSQQWRDTLATSKVDVRQARALPLSDSDTIRLSSLGASSQSVPTVNHTSWQTNFSYRSVDFNGKVPSHLVLDIAAAPDTSGTRPVVSVTWNDILLTASQLQADGEREHITARVPPYAIGQSNSIKVMLQRLPSANGCTEPQVGFPFIVLPSSYISTDAPVASATFVGVMPLLAYQASLVLPANWLSDAPTHLPQVVRLAAASGLSPYHATLQLLAQNSHYTPSGPFVAMDVPVTDVTPNVVIQDNSRLVLRDDQTAVLDVSGLRDVSSIEVVRSGDHLGLYWAHLPGGGDASSRKHDVIMPYDLDRGDLAIVTPAGLVSWLDSTDPSRVTLTDRVHTAFYEWRRLFSWGIPTIIGLLLFVILLLALAYRAGRRRSSK